MPVSRADALRAGLPLAVAVFALVDALLSASDLSYGHAAFAVVATAPLLVRHRWPASAGIAVAALIVLQVAVGVDLSQVIAPVVVLGIAAFGVGSRLPLRRAVVTGAVMTCLVWTSEVLEVGFEGSNPVFAAVLTFGALSMGRVLQTRQQALEAAAVAERAVAVTHERTRIARELHDVIAHTVTVMVVQAAAAEQVLDLDPGRARRALQEVQQAGRDALLETARLLDLLREEPDDAAPQPGLAELEALVRETPGLQVDLDVQPSLPPLPPGADVSVCRIVQEALTNVLKHSASRRPRVQVAADGGCLVVRVEDPGPAQHHGRLPGGHGLVGMRERAEMYGGTFKAGPVRSGWAVEARIPAAAGR